jgi:hypothetical protein
MRFWTGSLLGVLLAALVFTVPAFPRAGEPGDEAVAIQETRVDWGSILGAPDNLRVTDAKKNAVKVAWSERRGGDRVRYRVYRDGTPLFVSNDNGAAVSGLDCGRTYTIGVVAFDGAGRSSAMSTVVAETDPCGGGLRVVLSAPRFVASGALLRADTNGDVKSVSFGYCRGRSCTWSTASLIGTVRVGDDDNTRLRWRVLPADGEATLLAHAVDQRGRFADSAPVAVTVDSTPPDTRIASGPPPYVATRSASFTLSASEPVQEFECSLDGSRFEACLPSFTITRVSAGSHTLTARATDLAGNTDAAPASLTWTVDDGPPETTIVSGPPTTGGGTTASFVLAATEPATFQCSIDGGVFTSCSAAPSFTGLAAGAHRFAARALDRAGNADPTPASWSWTLVAATPPGPPTPPAAQTTITSSPSAFVRSSMAVIMFTSTYSAATFECSLDAAAYVLCASPATLTGLGEGAHTFLVRAVLLDGTRSTPASASWTVDTTAPAVTVSASRAPDTGTWYRSPVAFTTTGIDAGGPLSCTPAQTYNGPDTARASITGSCTDLAGNTGSASSVLAFDGTAPAVTVAPSRGADSNGWYNHALSFAVSGTDVTSGGVSCTAVPVYSGPDAAGATVVGNCADDAGNVGSAGLGFKYDSMGPTVAATPSRASDHDGWYSAPFSVSFTGSDVVSGGVQCVSPSSYGGPDATALQLSGSCTDAAGNTGSVAFSYKYDASAPSVTASLDRAADRNGWFNHPVSVSFAGVDALSSVTCDLPKRYSGPGSPGAAVTGTCADGAGNVASGTVAFQYDSAGPTVTAGPDRPGDRDGWYNHPVTVSFAGSDGLSGGVVCDAPRSYDADSASALVAGSCTDAAGNSGSGTFGLSYDATAPSVAADPGRAPDRNGWYNHPLTISFSGADALSGGVACGGNVGYSTDASTATVSGSCTDAAGNSGTGTYGFKYDGTAPAVTASADRSPDHNGWYNQPLAVSFAGTDSLSSGVHCDPVAEYATDAAAASVSGSCTDAAGNVGTSSVAFKYDATGPQVSATPDRVADRSGWYNHPLAISFSGSDAVSGDVVCDPTVNYGTDAASALVAGSCSDGAGNTRSASFGLSYDSTAPDVTVSPSRSADRSGWYNRPLSVSFAGSDGLSGGVACDAPVAYSGDAVSAAVSGSCSDAAGNAGSGSFALRYDATAPVVTASGSRPPDSNGWYNHPLTISFAGSDGLSGGVACDGPAGYSSDAASASVPGSCSDAAGNAGSGSFALRYDATAPVVTASASRAADSNGWYNHPLTIAFGGSDTLSGGVSCDPAATYATDSASGLVGGTCTDDAGNVGDATLGLSYDSTAPTVTSSSDRTPDHNGWYSHPVTVSFQGSDALSNPVTCEPAVEHSTDAVAATIAGSCSDAAGNAGGATFGLKYDATAPDVTASPDRAPDHGGWYNHAVHVSYTGTDATSGIAACALPTTYLAPDLAAATATGSCSDAAGNVSGASLGFNYDSTAPDVSALVSRAPDSNGWYNHQLAVSFAGTDSTSGGVACDAPVSYTGPDSGSATLSGACRDAAGNVGAHGVGFAFDATAPAASVVLSRSADHNGWYNHPVGVSLSGSDTVSGGVLCTAASTFGGPDSAAARVGGTCTDAAGNPAAVTTGLSFDATPPTVDAAPSHGPNEEGWYNAAFGVSFGGTDALSGVESCSSPVTYGGPDVAAVTLSGTCTDRAGNSASGSLDARYDSTPPVVAALASRGPDANGWYNHAFGVTFSGTDLLSGGVACDSLGEYSGPDTAVGELSGGCQDAAGNAAVAFFSFAFDSTPPSVSLVASRPPDAGGYYNHPVTFAVSATDGTSSAPSCPAPISYSGPDTPTASVTASCTDAAGNAGNGSASFKYDTTPPDTLITGMPASVVNVSSAAFTFTASETGSSFACTLDGTTTPCTAPFSRSDLLDGSHTFRAAATDPAGNTDLSPATFSWIVDTIAPETGFTATPEALTNQPATFTISSPDSTAGFQCSLDGATFTSCGSSVSLGTPSDGSHTFRARAVDPAGNVDATPVAYTWSTDTLAPSLSYTGQPNALTSATTATFAWTTGEAASFSCRLDSASFTNCGATPSTSGTRTLNSLPQGAHTFSVRATDAAGNRSTTPLSWTVDAGPPDTDLLLPLPANPTASTSASFAFTATEPSSTFKCKLDSGSVVACNSGTTSYSGLADGTHVFSVFATDLAGNADATPATWTWVVDATLPSGAFTAPTDGATVSGISVAVTVSASDNVSILGVQLKLDGAPLGAEIASAPYSINWDTSTVADGAHTLTAEIRDEVSNVRTIGPLHVDVHNAVALPAGTVDVGPGFVDASTRQVLRTSAGRVYIIAADDTAAVNNPVHAANGRGVLRAYKGNSDGVPTAFAEADPAHRPASGSATTAISGADARLGSDGVARVLYSDNAFGTPLVFTTFSTATDTWGSAEEVAPAIGSVARGRLTYALGLDASDVAHVAYVKSGTLYYVNRIGGTWSSPVEISSGTPLHPMLAFDRTGALHLSWLDDAAAGRSVMYARRSAAGTWEAPETVAAGDVLSNVNADQGPSIAVDAGNNPYTLYISASKGTFGPAGHTSQYGALRIKKRIGGSWTADDPAPDLLTHTPQLYMRGDDVYAFNGHDTDINFSYAYRLAGLAWSGTQKLTTVEADGSANVRWDALHETDPSIIDAAFFNEDRFDDHSFLPEVYYRAVTPSTAPAADATPPAASLTAPLAGTVSGETTVTATASDNVGVAGVQLKLDGVDLGPELGASPYTYAWDTASVVNGVHTLTATARDGAGNLATSASVIVDVQNAAPATSTLLGDATVLTHSDFNAAGDMEAFAVTADGSGSLSQLQVYLDAPLPSSLAVGLYADNGGTPGTLLGSASFAVPAAGWNSVGLGPLALAAGAPYWVALLVPAGATGVVNFRDGHAAPSVWYKGHALATLPPEWPGGTPSSDGPLAFYGTM